MLWWTLQWIIISLVLITLLHYLYSFFKNTLTIPKIKDLVTRPNDAYNEIMSTIQERQHSRPAYTQQNNPTQNDDSMQDELKNFLDELKKPKNTGSNTGSTTIEATKNNMFESANESSFSNSFSSY